MSPSETNPIISLPGFRLKEVKHFQGFFEIHAEFIERQACPHCKCPRVWIRSRKQRRVRHESLGLRASWLIYDAIKFECPRCGRFFYPRIKGIGLYQRSSERFKDEISEKHHKGIAQSQLAYDHKLGAATIERWYHKFTSTKIKEYKNRPAPRVLGIDEHFFSRKRGFATTLADLSKQRVFDLTLGRSEKSLEDYLLKLPGRERTRVLVMDLSDTYKAIGKKYFPNALIVADRFHVIRLINHQFLKSWRRFDDRGRYNRGLLSLMRRHEWNLSDDQKKNLKTYLCQFPILHEIYNFKQELNALMIEKHHNQRSVRPLITKFLSMIEQLKNTDLDELKSLGNTLCSWKYEIARMWRFTKTNSILEGLHNKMEMLSRRAFGFRKFDNYRIRVLAHCGG